MTRKFKIKSGDEVIVIAGRSKGKKGKVIKLLTDKERVIVQGINTVRRHTKPSAQSAGGIVEKEASLHISNVSLMDSSTGKPTKVGYKIQENGVKVRVARKSGEVINK